MRRKAEVIAALVAIGLVGTFGLLRKRLEDGTTRIVDQMLASPSELPWAGVVFRVAYSRSDAERMPSLEVLDARGARYPLLNIGAEQYEVPLGYATNVVAPRVRVFSGSDTLAILPLQPFPPPRRFSLLPTRSPAFQAVYRRGNPTWNLPDEIEITPLIRPTRSDWSFSNVRTTLSPAVAHTAFLPYAKDIAAIEFTATLATRTERTTDVTVEGLRLERRASGFVIIADHPIFVETPLGQLIAPVQVSRPLTPTQPVSSSVRHSKTDGQGKTDSLFLSPRARVDLSIAKQAVDPNVPSATIAPDMSILSPSPEELGLRELIVGTVSRKSTRSQLPSVKLGPISLKLRLTDHYLRVIGRLHEIVLVHPGAPQAKPSRTDAQFAEWSYVFPRPSVAGLGRPNGFAAAID